MYHELTKMSRLDLDSGRANQKLRTRRALLAAARVCVNGRFNELLDGFDTELEDGDRVALVNPFMYCC